MVNKSKEEDMLDIFFNYPTKHWHFKDIKKNVPIADNKISRWLKLFIKQGFVKRYKPQNKMPYYLSNYDDPRYKNKKRLYALEKMNKTGFIDHISSLKEAKIVILFGSFSRWDWYDDSDIDLFIFGKDDDLDQGKYELKLKRDIQVHTAKNKKDLAKMDKLLPYILSGDFIKGSIQDLGVDIHAKA